MTKLSAIRAALLEELRGDVTKLHFINTRLILHLGVNLNEISGSTNEDRTKVESTVKTLQKMGFLLGGEARRA